jgi:hypothetical protein
MKISVAVTYTSSTKTVTVTPNSLLFKNSTYKLRIVGDDLSAVTGAVESDTDTKLVETSDITFTTGDQIDVPTDSKDTTEKAAEGQLDLPSSLIVGPTARFQLVSVKPKNNTYNFTGDNITLTFNRAVNNKSVTGNIILEQVPFLDEDGWIARANSGSTDDPFIFAWDASEFPSTAVSGFHTPPNWGFLISGSTVRLNIAEASGNAYRNIRYELTVTEDLYDQTGNYLTRDEFITFTSKSYPDYVTPRTIRNEVNSVFDSLNLDFVHELVWKYSVDAFRLAGMSKNQFTDNSKGHREMKNYVKASTALAIMRDLFMTKTVMAGITKTLGDMTIAYHPNAGNADMTKHPILKHYTDLLKRAERAIAFRTHIGRPFIRGWASDLEPSNYRQRLWKNPTTSRNNSGFVQASNLPVSNTRGQRAGKLPGVNDLWS